MALPLVLAAGLPEIFAAVALLLIAWALGILLVKPVAFLLGKIPVVGGQIANALGTGAADVTDWALTWAKHGIDAFVQVVSAPVVALVGFVTELVATVFATASRLLDLFAQVATVTAWAGAQLRALWAQLTTLSHSVATGLLAVPGIARSIAAALVSAAVTTLRQAIAAVSAALSAGLAAERAALQAAQGNAAKALAAQAAVLAAAIAAGDAAVHRAVAADVRAVQGEVTQLGNLVRPIVASGVVATAAATAAELELLRRTCIEPSCSVISPQLPVLQALMDGTLLVLLGVAVEEAIRDPEGAAKATAGLASTIHRDAAGLFGLVAGVKL